MGVVVAFVVHENEYRNISASIGFIKRDNVLYMIKLGCLNEPSSTTINTTSGSLEQAATLKHNFEVAKGVQDAEKEIRERRKKEETYTKALDECLKRTEKRRSPLVNGVIEFYKISESRIEKETKNFIWISFNSAKGERITVKFRNAYGNLKQEIERQN